MKILTQINPFALLQLILFGGLFSGLLFIWSGAPMAAVGFSFVAGAMLTALVTLLARNETVIICQETVSNFVLSGRFCSMQDAQEMLDVPEDELFRFVNDGDLRFVRCKLRKNHIEVGFRTSEVNALVRRLLTQDALFPCCSVDEAIEALGVTFQEFADYAQDGVLPVIRRRDGTVHFRVRDVNMLISHLVDEQKTDAVMYSLDCVDKQVAKLTLDVSDGVFETLVRRGAIKTCAIRGRTCYFRPSLELVQDPPMKPAHENNKQVMLQKEASCALAKRTSLLPQLAEIVVYRDEDDFVAQLLRGRGEDVISRMWRFEGRIYVLKKDLEEMLRKLERSDTHEPDSA